MTNTNTKLPDLLKEYIDACLSSYLKEEDVECQVCCEDFDEYFIVRCFACNLEVCRECSKTYLLGSTQEAHCMGCKRAWSAKFMLENFKTAWVTGTKTDSYRTHRKEILLENEKAKIPETMAIISQLTERNNRKKKRENLIEERKEILSRSRKLTNKIENIRCKNSPRLLKLRERRERIRMKIYNLEDNSRNAKKICSLKADKKIMNMEMHEVIRELGKIPKIEKLMVERKKLNKRVEELLFIIQKSRADYYDNSPINRNNKPKINFICPCPFDDCRGMIQSVKFKCCICEKKVCRRCRNPLLKGHKCKKEDIASVKFIRTDTKPCPECAVPIHKIDGCDQMWCENCKVVFSWRDGKIETGIIHNPHAIEWQRRNGGMARNINDIPCGGLVPVFRIENICGTKYVLRNIYECMDRTTNVLWNNRADNNFNDIRENYLLGKTTEEKWKQNIFLRHRQNDRMRSVTEIATTFRTLAVEQIRNLFETYNEMRESGAYFRKELDDEFNKFIDTMDSLREFINETFICELRPLGSTNPHQIGEDWTWNRIN